MLRVSEIKLPLDHGPDALARALLKKLRIGANALTSFAVFKRGIDARKKSAILYAYIVDAEVADEAGVLARAKNDPHIARTPDLNYPGATRAPSTPFVRPVVIGAGPCGLFAALILAQAGYRPIILERGKVVRERTKDTWGLWRKSVLDPESNVQFGEGGAGTFSDGKLYSQIKDPRHLGRKVLTEFVNAGAPDDIRVADLDIDEARAVQSVVLADGGRIAANHVVLAPGHSARDVFQMLYDRGVDIEAKPFSIGFRIEHPQSIIDRARYGKTIPELGAAEYRLVHHAANGRSVYSFCMCPGGTVVAATSEEGRVATNGMSQYSRNERNANAGIVVAITPADYPGHVLAGIDLQRTWEARAFDAGGRTYKAPAQRVGDFLARRPSTALGAVVPSYKPGVRLTDLSDCLPDYAIEAIRDAIPAFARSIPGFAMEDAMLTGVETRTSSPIRIRRGAEFESLNTKGLYPAGEGAGFAGGILSAAVDGIKVAEAVAQRIAD
ncbi:MAG: FAD-dependent protein [Rhizomicrobium sp.]